jgi:hypothetical protein
MTLAMSEHTQTLTHPLDMLEQNTANIRGVVTEFNEIAEAQGFCPIQVKNRLGISSFLAALGRTLKVHTMFS